MIGEDPENERLALLQGKGIKAWWGTQEPKRQDVAIGLEATCYQSATPHVGNLRSA